MLLRRWALLKLIKGYMNVLEPFMSLLNKEIDQLFLEIVCGIGTHESVFHNSDRPRHGIG
jgi:hypothetical protein